MHLSFSDFTLNICFRPSNTICKSSKVQYRPQLPITIIITIHIQIKLVQWLLPKLPEEEIGFPMALKVNLNKRKSLWVVEGGIRTRVFSWSALYSWPWPFLSWLSYFVSDQESWLSHLLSTKFCVFLVLREFQGRSQSSSCSQTDIQCQTLSAKMGKLKMKLLHTSKFVKKFSFFRMWGSQSKAYVYTLSSFSDIIWTANANRSHNGENCGWRGGGSERISMASGLGAIAIRIMDLSAILWRNIDEWWVGYDGGPLFQRVG